MFHALNKAEREERGNWDRKIMLVVETKSSYLLITPLRLNTFDETKLAMVTLFQ